MSKIVTFGEIMLRLSPPEHERFRQATKLDMHYGGGEANIALSLAMFGHDASFVTKLPKNELGDGAIQSLRQYGVDCSHVIRGGDRLGLYFLENGVSIRPSRVIYDRSHSAIADASVDEFDFASALKDAHLLHISGITPAISQNGGELAVKIVETAKAMEIPISLDLNYRTMLWKDNVAQKQSYMKRLIQMADICFGNALDAQKCCGYSDHEHDFTKSPYEEAISLEAMQRVMDTYDLKYLVTSHRQNVSASRNIYSGLVCDGNRLYHGRTYDLEIVERIGTGDSMVAGFLHGLLVKSDMEYALEFGLAAAALKHTMPGDTNIATREEVEAIMESDGAARVNR
ncbi:MAG: sugar kinase [Lachnospiraceae bacterium]|nr:sugar kinase [Lachnospiraceae bacterium]